jgi:hypothetical protein
MPDTDMADVLVIGAVSGHARSTKSWVLGRLLRDLDNSVDDEMKDEGLHHLPPNPINGPGKPEPQITVSSPAKKSWEALRLTVFEVEDEPKPDHGVPAVDWVWCSGIVVIFIQLGIAAIPWGLYGDWDILLITAAGTLLALIGGSLPRWREEKWACTRLGGATVTITQGNGSRTAATIIGKRGKGLDLEILSRGTRTAQASLFTRIVSAVLALLWIVLLITVAGMKQHTWCTSLESALFLASV